MLKKQSKGIALIKMLLAMFIFGTSGILSSFTDFSSELICSARGPMGILVLLIAMAATGERPDKQALKKSFWPLLLAGAAIGLNWMLLFEAYRFTTIPVATLCYYMAPIFILLLTPLVLREKLSAVSLLCVPVAILGMALVCGVLPFGEIAGVRGIVLALGAAVFYTTMVLINKRVKENPGDLTKTVIEMLGATLAVLPFLLAKEDFSAWKEQFTLPATLILLCLGIVNTGLAYVFYFSSMQRLSGQSVAFLSYVDPLTAVILSALVLGQPMDVWGYLGAILIIGAALVSELIGSRKKKEQES